MKRNFSSKKHALIFGIIGALLLSCLGIPSAYAAGSGTITVKATAGSQPLQGVSFKLTANPNFVTRVTSSPNPAGTTFNKLSFNSYTLSLSLPMGYQLDAVRVNGSPVSNPTSRMQIPLQLTEAASNALVEIDTHLAHGSVFRSADTVLNSLFVTAAQKGTIVYEAASDLRAGPFDIVVILDFSGSMSWDMQGNVISWVDPNTGIEYTSDDPSGQDIIAKNSDNSRYHSMEGAVRIFLEGLKQNAVGNIGFVFFNYQATATSFTAIDEFSVDDFMENTMGSTEVIGGTRADLGFEAARKLLGSAEDPASGNGRERRVVFFTDGEPGNNGMNNCDYFPNDTFPPLETLDITPEYRIGYTARNYDDNGFRVMAETQNQANIIKGAFNTQISTNEHIEARSPFDPSEIWQEDTGLVPLGTTTRYLGDTDSYYGASVDYEKLGFVQPTLPATQTFGAVLDSFYASRPASELSAFWNDSTNWVTDYTDPYTVLSGNLSPLFEWDYRDLSTWNTIPSGYKYTGASGSAANWASIKHGNYVREAVGQGAIINTVGIVDESSFVKYPEKEAYVTNFMSSLATDGADGYFPVASAGELETAFETVYEEIVGEYPGVYIRFEKDSDWSVFTAAGNVIKSDSSANVWRDGNYIWYGPTTARSDQPGTLSYLLFSPNIASVAGTYLATDPSVPTQQMLSRITVYKRTGSNTFVEMDPNTVWISSLVIGPR